MTSIKEFIDENDIEAEDVIDALDIDPAQFTDYPDEPHEFYDGQPDVEALREDFDAVDLLADKKEDLADENEDLKAEVREARRPVFEDKADTLTQMTTKWGDTDALLEQFDDGEMDVSDVEDKIELAKDILDDVDASVTTVDEADDSDNEEFEFESSAQFADEDSIERTESGSLVLSDIRN
jgi:hypothetical protein